MTISTTKRLIATKSQQVRKYLSEEIYNLETGEYHYSRFHRDAVHIAECCRQRWKPISFITACLMLISMGPATVLTCRRRLPPGKNNALRDIVQSVNNLQNSECWKNDSIHDPVFKADRQDQTDYSPSRSPVSVPERFLEEAKQHEKKRNNPKYAEAEEAMKRCENLPADVQRGNANDLQEVDPWFNTEERRRWFLLWKSRVMPKECWSPADGDIEDSFDLENPHYAGRDESHPIKAAHAEIDDDQPDEVDPDVLARALGMGRQKILDSVLKKMARRRERRKQGKDSSSSQSVIEYETLLNR